MNYTIAVLKQVHSEIELELSFGMNGNKYDVGLSWLEENGHAFRTVTFEDYNAAYDRFQELSDCILRGRYNLQDRIKILEGTF